MVLTVMRSMDVTNNLSRNLPAIRNLAYRLIARARRPSFVIFMGVYVALIAWFKWFDLYQSHVATAGPLAVVHNLFRVVFIFYLFAMVHAVGAAVLRIVAGRTREGIGVPDHLALGFFTGIGIWHVGLLLLGMLGLATAPVAIVVTLPAVALSYLTLFGLVTRAGMTMRSAAGWTRGPHASRRIALAVAFGLVVAAGTVLLMVAAQCPVSGVLNEAGLSLIGVLLAGPFAFQLVAICFMAAGALALFLLVRRFMAGTLWPWAAVVLYLVLNVDAFGGGLLRHPGAPELRHAHGLGSALVAGILWATAGAIERRSRLRIVWAIAAASAVTAAVIVDVTIAIDLVTIFGLLTLWFAVRRDRNPAATCFALLAVTAIALAIDLALDGQGLALFRRGAGDANVLPGGILASLVGALRIDLLYPLIGGGVAVALAALALRAVLRLTHRRSGRGVPAPYHAAVLAAAAAALLIIATVAGRGQASSLDLDAGIGVSITIAAGIWLWATPFETAFPWLRYATRWWPVPLIVTAGCFAAVWAAGSSGTISSLVP